MDATKKATVTAACHCKAVRLTFPSPENPLTECLCSICRRYGALWVSFQPEEVQVGGGPTEFYSWGDKDLQFHRCKECGCVTHWEPADKEQHKIISVNCRMLEREDLEKFPIKKSDGPKK